MDIRRSINTRVWTDDWFENLNPSEKLLWLYLLTNPHTNMLGIYEVTIKRISFDTGLTKSQIETFLNEFEKYGKVYYWDNYLFLPNWMKNQRLNENMMKGAERMYDNLPSSLITRLIESGFESFESLSNGCQILRKKEKEIEIENEKESEKENGAKNNQNTIQLSEEEEIWKGYIDKNYPKLFKMRKPLEYMQHQKLISRFGKGEVVRVYERMENWPELTKKRDSAYLTAKNFLRTDNPNL